MVELPVPTHAFIGGSSGNMNEIIRLLLDKNPGVRIVINCITLETVTEAMNAIRDFSLTGGYRTAVCGKIQIYRKVSYDDG